MNVWYSFSAHFVEKPSNFDERDNFTYEDINHEEYNIGKLEKHLEKVLKCNKRGFHRKKSSNDEVTNSTSTQQDVHFGQGLRKFGNRGKGYGNNNDINEELNFHAPSSALEGNMFGKKTFFINLTKFCAFRSVKHPMWGIAQYAWCLNWKSLWHTLKSIPHGLFSLEFVQLQFFRQSIIF